MFQHSYSFFLEVQHSYSYARNDEVVVPLYCTQHCADMETYYLVHCKFYLGSHVFELAKFI
jgi:hypothetical protein